MKGNALIAAAGLVAPASALLRFPCSSLTVQRLDPLVNPGVNPSPHLHQVVGGNAFNITMDPTLHDIAKTATCTTCQFSEDFSNYWTATVFFKAKNGTYRRVPQMAQDNGGAQGGMMVYYMTDALFDTAQKSAVTAFKPGFRMIVGDAGFKGREDARKFRQLTFTCMQNSGTRAPEFLTFPEKPCPAGIMANHRFPTCWDGKNLDSPNHQDHVAYPETGTFESGGACPSTHPVRLPQILLETVWDTRTFNSPSDWPATGQPFLWSNGDDDGYSSHADYVFGWKDEALQKAMDGHTYVSAPMLKSQGAAVGNKCKVSDMVNENLDGWLAKLPGL